MASYSADGEKMMIVGSSSSGGDGKEKVVRLISSDGEAFNVELAVVQQMPTIVEASDGDIPLQLNLKNVTGSVLSKVLQYCKKHMEKVSEDELKNWDADFLNVDKHTLFDIIRAADYLRMDSLADCASHRVAGMIKEMSREEIAEFFQLKECYGRSERDLIKYKELLEMPKYSKFVKN